MITQTNYNTAKQSIRNLRIKINLLNFNLQTVDDIIGNVIAGSVSIDANSDVRRTCDITLVVTDSSFDVANGGKIWLDKYVQIYTGIDDIRTGETDWINQGIYIINNPKLEYDAVTNTLSFQGLDLMSKLTGVRNGYMDNITTVINQGDSIRNVMIDTLTQFTPFTKYAIDDNPQTVPYEMRFEVGSTVYDILAALRDITPNYEVFFDVNGTFVYQKIPTGLNDAVVADNDLWDSILLSDSTDVNFDEVKNNIVLMGRSHDPDYFAEATLVGNEYQVTIANITALTEGLVVGFTTTARAEFPTLKINDLAAMTLVNENGSLAVLPQEDVAYYIVRILANGDCLYMGRQQIIADVSDDNIESPYYINGTIGKIRLPLYGGEYDNIVTEDLAYQRARYELWLRTRINDAINITCIPAYFLDVNQKIAYSKGGADEVEYLIKTISFDLSESGTMEINAIKFYEEYESELLDVDGGTPSYDYSTSFNHVDGGTPTPYDDIYEPIDAGGV